MRFTKNTPIMKWLRRGVLFSLIALSAGSILHCSRADRFFDAIFEEEFADPEMPFKQGGNLVRGERSYHTATKLKDGTVLIAGGYRGAEWYHDDLISVDSVLLRSAEVYDPATNSCKPVGNMHVRRRGHAATLLADGRVLITGGERPGKPSLGGLFRKLWDAAEIYDPGNGTFRQIASMNIKRVYHSATLLPDNTVLIAGGELKDEQAMITVDGKESYKWLEIFDPATEKFTAVALELHYDRSYSHGAVLLDDGRVMFVGGDRYTYTRSIEFYDYKTGTISLGADSTTTRRWLASACKLADGRVLLTGGYFGENNQVVDSSAEIFDPASNTFTDFLAMTNGWRIYHQTVLLDDGRVLITGGRNRFGEVNTAEVFDPSDNSFTSLGCMTTFRRDHTCTLLDNGNVLIVGGRKLLATNVTTEIFGDAEVPSAPGSEPVGEPPSVPSLYPPSGKQFVDLMQTLVWRCSDPDSDAVTYDLYLGNDPYPAVASSAQSDTFLVPDALLPDTIYYWMVEAKDANGNTTRSPMHTFRTAPFSLYRYEIDVVPGNDVEKALWVEAASDGGCILACRHASQEDGMLVKLNSSGKDSWRKTYSGAKRTEATYVSQTADDGYFVGVSGLGAVRTGTSGDSLWTADRAKAPIVTLQTADNGYVILSEDSLYRLDQNHAYTWVIGFEGVSMKSLLQAGDGNFVVAGKDANSDMTLMKLDANGDSLWRSTILIDLNQEVYCVQQTSDGGYVVAGATYLEGEENFAGLLVKTDANGGKLWAKTIGLALGDHFRCVRATPDNGFILTGETWGFSKAGDYDTWLIKTDSQGEPEWGCVYGESGTDEKGKSVAVTTDGGYVVTGYTEGSGGRPAFVVKVDANGKKVF